MGGRPEAVAAGHQLFYEGIQATLASIREPPHRKGVSAVTPAGTTAEKKKGSVGRS